MIVELNGERVDIKHRTAIFLRQLYELGGTANTRDVTSRSGLKDWQVNEEWEKAEEEGLVEWTGQYDTASRGPGSAPKIYELTGRGRALVQRGIPDRVIRMRTDTDAKVPEKSIEDLQEALVRLERRVDKAQTGEFDERFEAVREQLNGDDGLTVEEVQDLRAEFEEFEDDIRGYNQEVKTWLFALRDVVERELGVDLEDEMEPPSPR